MKYAFPLAAVIALILIALIGVQIPGMQYLFGVFIPYVATMVFVAGFIYRVYNWGKSPVPFRIPTTCGQGFSLRLNTYMTDSINRRAIIFVYLS